MSKFGDRAKDPLCCCEYSDLKGDRSHILACCCDCEAVDTLCDKLITCQSIPDETVDKMFVTIEDRCRLPWFGGDGAKRISLDVAFPVIVVPVGLLLATYGPLSTLFVFICFPVLLLAFYRNWLRRPLRPRTRLFVSWGLVSVVQLYYTYITVVVGFREILLWETMLLTTLFFGMLYAFYQVKMDPGVVKIQREVVDDSVGLEDGSRSQVFGDSDGGDVTIRASREAERLKAPVIMEYEVSWVDSRSIKVKQVETWCRTCHVVKTPRSGHCPLCNSCIRLRDHHCVWIDSCVGRSNHLAFLVALCLCILGGAYGTHLTMTTVCTPEMYLDWFLWPSDCRFVYNDFPTALSFVSACYAYISIAGLSLILLQQLVLISQNVTLQELHCAQLRGWTRFLVYAKDNVNNRGFLRNWGDFLSGTRRERYLQTSANV